MSKPVQFRITIVLRSQVNEPACIAELPPAQRIAMQQFFAEWVEHTPQPSREHLISLGAERLMGTRIACSEATYKHFRGIAARVADAAIAARNIILGVTDA